jgi:opacity protein-like surface antigen
MMKNRLRQIGIVYICCYTITSITYADNTNYDKRFIYVGAEAGIVEPVQSKFRHKESSTDLTLKRSSMYSGKIGYSFYPQMAIEFSATHQPQYKLHYVLPEKSLAGGYTIPKTPGTTKVVSEIYMLNLIYDLNNINSFTPFVIIGAGIARMKVKATSSKWDLMNLEYFKVRKTKTNCFAWQFGIGMSREITENFSIDTTAKLQVIHKIKANYDTFDNNTGKFVPSAPINRTIGVGEFGIGFTYKLAI